MTGVGFCEAEMMGAPVPVKERVDQWFAMRVLGCDRGEAHGAAMAHVGVGGIAGLRAHDLLEDEHVARLKIREACRGAWPRSRPAGRQQSGVAPGVERHLVVFGIRALASCIGSKTTTPASSAASSLPGQAGCDGMPGA